MDESEPKEQKPEKQRRFSQEQYDILMKCSEEEKTTKEIDEKGLRCNKWQYQLLKVCATDDEGIKKWNEWRKTNPNKDILLEGAPLKNFYLRGADLRKANLEKADLLNAHLEGAKFEDAILKSAHFIGAIVDSNTNMWKVKVNQYKRSTAKKWLYTDFSGVPLQSVIIDPGTKQLIEYNIRHKYWEKWYSEENWNEIHTKKEDREKRSLRDRIIREPVRWFWLMSDYGLSTGRIVATFFALAFIFATIYYNWGRIAPPGIVENLFVDRNGIEVPWWLVPLRTLYFSIVTMTTLGFGDMYAKAQSIWGHILLSLQVILGYVLLGALVTRFAVLFTAGGPAGDFADDKKYKATGNKIISNKE